MEQEGRRPWQRGQQGKGPEVSLARVRAGRGPVWRSLSRSGKVDAGGAPGARQGQVTARGFNLSAKKSLEDYFFLKQGRDMNRFAFLKIIVAAEGPVDVV